MRLAAIGFALSVALLLGACLAKAEPYEESAMRLNAANVDLARSEYARCIEYYKHGVEGCKAEAAKVKDAEERVRRYAEQTKLCDSRERRVIVTDEDRARLAAETIYCR